MSDTSDLQATAWFEWLMPAAMRSPETLRELGSSIEALAAEQGATWPSGGGRTGVEIKALQSRLHELERQTSAVGTMSRVLMHVLVSKGLVTAQDIEHAVKAVGEE